MSRDSERRDRSSPGRRCCSSSPAPWSPFAAGRRSTAKPSLRRSSSAARRLFSASPATRRVALAAPRSGPRASASGGRRRGQFRRGSARRCDDRQQIATVSGNHRLVAVVSPTREATVGGPGGAGACQATGLAEPDRGLGKVVQGTGGTVGGTVTGAGSGLGSAVTGATSALGSTLANVSPALGQTVTALGQALGVDRHRRDQRARGHGPGRHPGARQPARHPQLRPAQPAEAPALWAASTDSR